MTVTVTFPASLQRWPLRPRTVEGRGPATPATPRRLSAPRRSFIELFQLVYLEARRAELPAADYALKDGGNLRFFLRSRRRSADLDFDYRGRRFDDFADRVDRVFASRALAELLGTRGITLVEPRRSKVTDTVKRWKLALRARGVEATATKLEFSARPTDAIPVFEAIDEGLARRAGIGTVRLNHYGPAVTIEQKLGALAGRSATEPRDVFDLDHLFREFPDALAEARLDPAKTRTAFQRALELPYARYAELVVRYLDDEFVPLYGTEEAWNDMVLRVVARLDELVKPART